MIRNRVIATVVDDYKAQLHLLNKFKDELKNLPVGSICVKKIRGKDRFYHHIPSGIPGVRATQVYLGKRDEKLRTGLCRRKFIESSLPDLEKTIKLEKLFLENYAGYDPGEVAERLPKPYRDIDYSPILDGTGQNPSSLWLSEPYEKNTIHQHMLVHKTQNGLRVRSKSESIIAAQLESNDIPFRYEALLSLNGHKYYPDFTILSPQDNRVIYWEHFGMWDKDEYVKAAERKIAIYKKHGILLWDNLIATYETGANPLDAQNVRKVIKAFLLPEV